jgi:methyl coenzyme M reductase alpha subunit
VTRLVQVTIAGDVTEAEEIERILAAAGIAATLEAAVEEHPAAHGDAAVKILVGDAEVDAARDAIEALSEPDELIDED